MKCSNLMTHGALHNIQATWVIVHEPSILKERDGRFITRNGTTRALCNECACNSIRHMLTERERAGYDEFRVIAIDRVKSV